jgi:hypothetical protein
MNADRRKTLQELENQDWGQPTYDSYLVSTVHSLRRKPLEELTTEDLRIMIGQNIELDYLMPLAVEKLRDNPLAEGDYYPGDLLKAVLGVEPLFWEVRPDLREAVEKVLDKAVKLINDSTEEDYQATKEALEEGTKIFETSRRGTESHIEKKNV